MMIFDSEFKIRVIKGIDKYIGQFIIYIFYYLSRFLNKKYSTARKPEKPKRFLLIKLFGIGNIFLILPSAKILKDRFKNLTIDLITLSSNKGIVEHVDIIDGCLYIKDDSFFSSLMSMFYIIYKIRKENYGVVIDFEQFALVSTIFAFFSRAFSIGFKTSFSSRHLLYSQTVDYIEDRHTEDIFKTLLEPIGCYGNKSAELNFNLNRQEGKVRGFMEERGIYFGSDFVITIHPGSSANFKNRRWPAEKFGALTKMIIDCYDVKLIFTGKGKDEARLLEGIIGDKVCYKILNICDLFSLDEFIALIKMSNLVITNDTAPVQITSALNIPCLAFFGPNTPSFYGPKASDSTIFYKSLACSPCITNSNSKGSSCNNPECVNAILTEEVFDSVKDYYSRWKKSYNHFV